MEDHIILGVDIGGTGIKGGLVDVQKGEMVSERYRLPTPQPATPQAIAETFQKIIQHFSWKGLVGVGFPAIVRNGEAYSASNIDKSWLGTNIEEVLSQRSGCDVYVLNDADAAGLASLHFGVGLGENGVTILLTIGTGIGSAVFSGGQLIPNTELGHLYLKNQTEVVEKQLSKKVRKEQNLSWLEWSIRFNEYLHHIDRLFSPNLVILGGGGSKKFDDFKDFIQVDFDIKPAVLLNHAGTIGAAYYAWQQSSNKGT